MTKANVWTDTLAFIFFEGAAFGEVFTFGFSWACCARWFSTLITVNEPLMVINAACFARCLPSAC